VNVPKTRIEDLLNYVRKEKIITREFFKGKISLEKRNKMFEKLILEYRHRIFPEDSYLFDNIGEFWKFLIDNNLSTDCVTHEMLHARKAFLLGYDIKYCCRMALTDDGRIAFLPSINIKDTNEKMNKEDLLAIISATDVLSEEDKNMIEYLKE